MLIVKNLGTIILPPSKLTEGLTWMTTGSRAGDISLLMADSANCVTPSPWARECLLARLIGL